MTFISDQKHTSATKSAPCATPTMDFIGIAVALLLLLAVMLFKRERDELETKVT